MATTTAAEITKLVGAATDAARKAVDDGNGNGGGSAPPPEAAAAVRDAAEESRAVDALKALAKLPVTAALLRDTDAGKRVNRLCKSASARIAAAASAAVAAWKASVRSAAAAAAATVKAEPAAAPASETKAAKSSGENGGSEPTPATAPAAPAAAPSSSQGAGATAAAAAAAASEPSGPAAATTTPAALPTAASVDASAPPPHDPPPRTGDARRDKLRAVLAAALALALPEIEADGGAEPDEDGYVELPRGAGGGGGEGGDGDGANPTTASLLPGRDAPGRVAAAIEEEVLRGAGGGSSQSPAYAARGRSLAFNLRAPDNPALRRRALLGRLPPERLASMTPEEMASDARRRENEAMREKGKWEAVRGQQQAATTDQFQCGKCKQRKTTFFQLQTRSADEPMTTFVTCVVCNNRWKFC
jgi:transcription elongation factor S-II